MRNRGVLGDSGSGGGRGEAVEGSFQSNLDSWWDPEVLEEEGILHTAAVLLMDSLRVVALDLARTLVNPYHKSRQKMNPRKRNCKFLGMELVEFYLPW